MNTTPKTGYTFTDEKPLSRYQQTMHRADLMLEGVTGASQRVVNVANDANNMANAAIESANLVVEKATSLRNTLLVGAFVNFVASVITLAAVLIITNQ